MPVKNCTTPPHPLPPPLLVSDDGSFAQNTVRYRLPRLARQAIDSAGFPTEINRAIQGLIAELPFGRLRPIRPDGGPDIADWAGYLEPFTGRRWFDIPWFLAETYFYRRLLEATGYFAGVPTSGIDPYVADKHDALMSALPAIRTLADQVNALDVTDVALRSEALVKLLHYDLWGNQVDMTLWAAGSRAEQVSRMEVAAARDHILADQTDQVIDFLRQSQQRSIHFVVDNAGFELFCDLLLVDYLLRSDIASVVRLHLKPHPTFVSDALIRDVSWTIDTLRADSDQATRILGDRLQGWVDECRLQFDFHYFWTSPLPLWQMPDDLRSQLAAADLVFFKGDANYRRLLGDLHWPLTSSFSDILCYFPAPLVALRTLKSELGAGLPASSVERLSASEPDWLVNGNYGVIQFVRPSANGA